MRPIKISITKAHIRDGVPGNECDCPIALALKDALLTNDVAVNPDGMRVNNRTFSADKKDRRFIERFDNGKPVKPYSFEINRTNRR